MSITKMRKNFTHYFKPLLIGIAVVFVIGIPAMYMTGPRPDSSKGGNIIATINGKQITREELFTLFDSERKSVQGSYTSPLQDADILTNILRQLADERLKLSIAEKKGLGAGYFEIGQEKKNLVDGEIERWRQVFGQGRKVALSDQEFNMFLSRQNPPTSIASLRKQLNAEISRDDARRALLIRKLGESVYGDIEKMNDKELRESFRQVKVSQIIIGGPEAQAKRKAAEIVKKARAGEDFAKLAKENSTDPSAKTTGGDMGYVYVYADKALKGLKQGQVSDPIKMPSLQVYRIIKAGDSKLELPPNFEKNKAQIREQLVSAMKQQAWNEFYMEEQRKSKLEIKDPELKGYWIAANLVMMQNSQDRDKVAKEAIASLDKAVREDPDNARPRCKLAEIYQTIGKDKEAISQLEIVLDEKNGTGEGADLRIMLAKLYIKQGNKEKAVPHLEMAREVGYADRAVRAELETLFKNVGRADLAAEEAQWLKDYDKRQAATQQPVPQPKPEQKQKTKPEPKG